MGALYRTRRYSHAFSVRAAFIAIVFTLTVVFQRFFPVANHQDVVSEADDEGREEYGIEAGAGAPAARRLLIVVPPAAIQPYNTSGSNDNSSTELGPANASDKRPMICTPPAYHEFPSDAFTSDQRRHGAIILHTIMVVYMFIALAIVCDVYFVSSLEKICTKLNLSADVAGATFMAAGSSAPELFTSIIGVFIAKGDVGVGTIVGSAVFNILFVVGICGVLVGQVVTLTWYPLMRDSTFYTLSVIMLIASIADAAITWYESTIMLVLYILYIITMKFDRSLQAWICPRVHLFSHAPEDTSILTSAAKAKFYSGNNYDGTTVPEMFQNENSQSVTSSYQSGAPPTDNKPRTAGPGGLGGQVIPVDEYVMKSTRKISFEDACFRFMKMRGFRPTTRFRSAVLIVICERRKLLRDPVFMKREHQAMYAYGSIPESYTNAIKPSTGLKLDDPVPASDWLRIPRLDEGYWKILKWVVLLPLYALLYYTVPDCNQKRWDRWFMVSFSMSIVWIAIFSYVMVWMVTLIGFTFGIPDSIMGITFLAAGTSVPDAMASVMVARQGQGDMAVSNTIGSNVFDVLIGLALPWWIKTVCVEPGSYVHINSNGMVYSVVLLFLTVIITIVSIHFGGWKLDKKLGVICLTCYAVFLVFSIMIEYNVFGYVNPPMCAE